jgi:hypothetical protein
MMLFAVLGLVATLGINYLLFAEMKRIFKARKLI